MTQTHKATINLDHIEAHYPPEINDLFFKFGALCDQVRAELEAAGKGDLFMYFEEVLNEVRCADQEAGIDLGLKHGPGPDHHVQTTIVNIPIQPMTH